VEISEDSVLVRDIFMSVCQWQPSGKRSRGRPVKRWLDCVEEDLRTSGVSKFVKILGRHRMTLSDVAEDREQWRESTMASMAESGWTANTRPDLTS